MKNFSVICSVYKNIKTKDLVASFQSLDNQYLRPKDLVIVIDGYCKKKNINFIKHFLKKKFKNKYKIIYNSHNKGIPYSYNKAISLAKYNYVAISDADDISSCDRFQKQFNHLEKNPSLGMVGAFIKELGIKKNFIKKVPISHNKIIFFSYLKNPINHPTVFFNKKVFFKKNIQYEECKRMEDYYLWIRAINKGVKFENIPEILVSTNIDKQFFKRRTGFELIASEFKIQKTLLQNNYFFFLFIIIIFLLKSSYHIVGYSVKAPIRNFINYFY